MTYRVINLMTKVSDLYAYIDLERKDANQVRDYFVENSRLL